MNPITIRHDLPAALIADIMNTASNDSINAWADIITYNQTEDPSMCKMELIETADDPPRHHTVTADTILLGMQRIIDLELPPPIRCNMIITMSQIREWIIVSVADGDATMIDADCADAIIQYGLFKELVYS